VQDEAAGAKRGVGDRLGEGDGGGDDDRGLGPGLAVGAGQRVEGGDPQPDQVRRRRELGLVAGPARGVVADPARGQVGAQRPGEVAGADVVGGDDQRRAVAETLLGVEQRRDQVGPDRGRGAQVDRLAGPDRGREAGESPVAERDVEQWAEQRERRMADRRTATTRLPGVSGSARRPLATVLAVLAALLLLGALVSGYASLALFDAEQFSDRAVAALDDEAVQDQVATRVTDDLVLNANADLVAGRPLIQGAISGIVGGGVFQGLLGAAVRDVHRAVFEQDQNTVALTLADVGSVVSGALQALAPKLSKQFGGQIDVEVTPIETPPWLADLARAADGIKLLFLILLVLGIAIGAGAIWLSPDRRRTALALGVAIAIIGVVAAVGLGIGRALTLRGVDDPDTRDAIDAIWGVFLDDLRTGLYLFAGCGTVIAAAASSLLRPVDIGAPLRDAGALIARIPERPALRVLRALVLIAAGIAIIVLREQALALFAVAAGLYVAYAGVSELMRMTMATDQAEIEAGERGGRRTLTATAIVAAAIMVAGTVFVGLGGASAPSLEVETEGCNGSQALCDQPLDQVAFATSHNAMSAVTNKGFLFAMQERGFADQLRDGVRGLLIDAHYGQPTEEGTIKTDLSDLSGSERKEYEQALGSAALDAALRIRDRAVASPTAGPRGVYLCHRFCELGAVPILDTLRLYRDFLAVNPDEVLVIVIEDYVAPEDIEAAVRESGLIDYVYKGPVGSPWPTLQEMIDSGGRALIMAEKDAGEIPWYHEAYDDGLVQETPFRFTRPEQLIEPRNLDASCEPNRGSADATLFLINHWIDTTPAPRPSNAKLVNARKVLLRRVRRCERQRGLTAGLIAVDFYRQGDLFGVVDELNAARTGG